MFIRIILIFILLLHSRIEVLANHVPKIHVAVIDIESVWKHTSAFISIKRKSDEFKKNIQLVFLENKKKLKKRENEILKQRENLQENEFNKKVELFGKKVIKLQNKLKVEKRKLSIAHIDAVNKIYEHLNIIFNELADKYGFGVVVPTTSVLFVKNRLNITLEVITLLNERLQEVEIEYRMD